MHRRPQGEEDPDILLSQVRNGGGDDVGGKDEDGDSKMLLLTIDEAFIICTAHSFLTYEISTVALIL